MGDDRSSVKRILIIKISAIGDIIRSLPSLSSVARIFPNAKIDFMISDKNVNLIEPCPYISEIIPYDVERYSGNAIEFWKFSYGLRKKKYDLVLNLQNTRRFNIMGMISGARERTDIITLERPTKGVEGVFRVLETVGINPKRQYFEFWYTEEDHAFAKKFLSDCGIAPKSRIAALCPGAQWLSKQWPLQYYTELANRIHENTKAPIIIFGGPGEESRAVEIQENSSAVVHIATGKTTLRQAARIISECSIFVSNDSGLMHLAAHVNTPTLGIFGSTNPAYHGPCGEGNLAVFRGVECSPCYLPECKLDFERYYCQSAISVDDVYRQVKSIMR